MFAPRDSLSTRFKKAASRTMAHFTGKPLDIDMISAIRMAKTHGARPVGGESLVAYHTQANTWNVYHVGYLDFYPGSGAIIKQHQALGLGLAIGPPERLRGVPPVGETGGASRRSIADWRDHHATPPCPL